MIILALSPKYRKKINLHTLQANGRIHFDFSKTRFLLQGFCYKKCYLSQAVLLCKMEFHFRLSLSNMIVTSLSNIVITVKCPVQYVII